MGRGAGYTGKVFPALWLADYFIILSLSSSQAARASAIVPWITAGCLGVGSNLQSGRGIDLQVATRRAPL